MSRHISNPTTRVRSVMQRSLRSRRPNTPRHAPQKLQTDLNEMLDGTDSKSITHSKLREEEVNLAKLVAGSGKPIDPESAALVAFELPTLAPYSKVSAVVEEDIEAQANQVVGKTTTQDEAAAVAAAADWPRKWEKVDDESTPHVCEESPDCLPHTYSRLTYEG